MNTQKLGYFDITKNNYQKAVVTLHAGLSEEERKKAYSIMEYVYTPEMYRREHTVDVDKANLLAGLLYISSYKTVNVMY